MDFVVWKANRFQVLQNHSEVVLVPLAKMSPLWWSHWQTMAIWFYSKVWQGTISVSVTSLKLRARIARDELGVRRLFIFILYREEFPDLSSLDGLLAGAKYWFQGV